MTGSRQRKPFGRAAWLLAIAVAVPAVSLSRVPGLHKLELLVYDWHCAALPRLPPDPRLVLIGMDDGSLDYLQRPSYPLPRSMHGRMVDILREAGAKVIAFDVMFTYAAPELKADDAAFAGAMARYGKVVAGLTPTTQFRDGRESVTFQEPDPRLRPYILAGSILMPRAFGNKVRWFPPYPADSSTTKRYLHLSVALVASYYG